MNGQKQKLEIEAIFRKQQNLPRYQRDDQTGYL